mmetsp:Transcript_87165/g.247423  ORF Transcript_87165/g.247423 Transcript_87165/m.247423 type:complete len:211 (+) Transcript_87165:65-697(+)
MIVLLIVLVLRHVHHHRRALREGLSWQVGTAGEWLGGWHQQAQSHGVALPPLAMTSSCSRYMHAVGETSSGSTLLLAASSKFHKETILDGAGGIAPDHNWSNVLDAGVFVAFNARPDPSPKWNTSRARFASFFSATSAAATNASQSVVPSSSKPSSYIPFTRAALMVVRGTAGARSRTHTSCCCSPRRRHVRHRQVHRAPSWRQRGRARK